MVAAYEVERALDLAIEVVLRDEVLQRHVLQRSKQPQLDSHHGP